MMRSNSASVWGAARIAIVCQARSTVSCAMAAVERPMAIFCVWLRQPP